MEKFFFNNLKYFVIIWALSYSAGYNILFHLENIMLTKKIYNPET